LRRRCRGCRAWPESAAGACDNACS
jgi:hypothetical protein